MKHGIRLFAMVLLAAFSAAPASRAYAQAVPQVQSQQMRDYVRLTFEWPEPTLFTAKTEENDVILTFDRKVGPNMASVLKGLHPYVTKAERKADGKTIVLTLDEPHRIRTFVSDNISGIDLLDVKAPPKRVAKAAPEPQEDDIAGKAPAKVIPVKKQAAKTDAVKKEPAQKSPAVVQAAPAAEVQIASESYRDFDLSALSPTAGETIMAQAVTTEPAPATVPLATAEPAAPAAPAEPAAVAQPPEPTVPPAPPEPAQPVQATPVPEPAVPAAAAEAPVAPEPLAMPQANQPAPDIAKVTPKPETLEPEEEEKPSIADGKLSHGTGVSMVPMTVDPQDEAPATEAAPAPVAAAPAPEAPAGSVEASQDNAPMEPLTSNKIVVSADAEEVTLRVPLKQRAAMAVFNRVNVMWIVFDQKLDFDLSDFENLPPTIISQASILPSQKGTIILVPTGDNVSAKVKQQEGHLDLAILLSTKKESIDSPMEIVVSTQPPALPYVFVPALEAGDTLEAKDPAIGDTLSITPFYTREQGVARTRKFVDFTMLPTTQGLAIVKKADATEVIPMRNGLRVTLPKGAHVSARAPGDDNLLTSQNPALQSGDTLFPNDMWALEKNKDLKLAMKRLFHQTVFGENEGAKNLARLRMAQLYLRDGFAVETLGLLDIINRSNPSYYRSAKLAAMHGAANFLLYRFNDAARDFGSAELNNNPEVKYWRDMLADLLGSPDRNYNFLAMNANYLSKYPPLMRQRLAIIAADRAIAAKEYNTALQIFDTLNKDNILEPIQPYVDFLTAKIASESGQEAQALEVWKKLAADSSNKFVQARATFSQILWELDNNVLTREQAMDKLERLRLGWHGDGLELQVVQLLGELYYEKNDYVNAMRVWQIGVTGFKNTGPAIEMATKMEDTFIKLFNEGTADKMSPLDALGIYYEYRNYAPGGATGTLMIEKLADRLIGVDLLSTAAQLLEQQMRTQMEKAERSRVGAKLAEIYLMNNQPRRAMKALQESVYGDNPILQRIKRNQLAAKAMMQLGRPQEALNVLGQDESVGAEKLRALIYWNEQDWPNLTLSVENIFKKRPDPSAPLEPEEGEYLLRLALAYVFQNDAVQLQYMRDYFGPLMNGNPYKQAFEFVTTPDINIDTRNFDELLKVLSQTRTFIDGYKARVDLEEKS